ncbi:MAG: hypothetical protein LBR90_03880 [Elusimicrobiota bacterium]|jgi:hypothetical protein|nr:hypothetical protein [Elusimicrobiota bacterium]
MADKIKKRSKLGTFFKTNTFRVMLGAFILFMAIPFFFMEETPVPQRDVYGNEPVTASENPLSKILNRVGGFYGKALRGAYNKLTGAAAKPANLVVGADGQVYIMEEDGAISVAPADVAADFLVASAASPVKKRDNTASLMQMPDESQVREFVRMDGKTYEVLKGAGGEKFVLTDKGPVSYVDLMKQTVSEEDFAKAKKAAPKLSDQDLFMAMQYPGGVPAFIKTYGADGSGLYSRPGGGSPGMFGKSGGQFGSGASMFGPTGGTAAPQDSLVARYNAANAAFTSARGQGVDAAKQAATQEVIKEIAIAFPKRVVGENPLEIMAEINTPPDTSNVIADINNNSNFITPENKEARKRITEGLLGKDFNFKGDDSKKKGESINDPWVFPKNITENTPSQDIFFANPVLANQDEDLWVKADTAYNNAKSDFKNDNTPSISVVIIDGMGENGDLFALSSEKQTPYFEIIKNMYNGRAENPIENIDGKITLDWLVANKDTVVTVVSDPKLAEAMKDTFYVSLWEDFSPAPATLTNVYEQLRYNGLAVAANTVKEAAKTKADKQTAEIKKEIKSNTAQLVFDAGKAMKNIEI